MRRTTCLTIAAAAFVSAWAGTGCRTEEPKSPEVGLDQPVDPPEPPDLGRGAARIEQDQLFNLWLADPVFDVCKGPSPFFAFDSAKTAPTEQPTMQTLSTCMVAGPLKGQSIRLVGHTDPRGAAEYNEDLGLARADRVKRYLVAHGVDEDRVLVATAGEEESSNLPPEWPRDRRVEIQLVQ